ncbi:MAG: LysR substrate-binding domain-containing protein [Acidobacteriota bacterium]|nr:LysR substrate-binding domain-containing protein [Acidobacteriota bacterium]
MSHRFSLRQLEYAVAVADTLNFRKAAERCNVSQPSLSAQLAQLEEAIGVRLFERDRRRVLLTAQGGDVIARARELLRQADDVELSARRAGDPFAGTMRIGIIPTVSPYLLPRVAPKLRREYPRLHVLWREEKTAVLSEQLESGALDAMLVAKEAHLGEVDVEGIAHDRFILAAARTHPLMQDPRPVRASALRGENVLLLEDGHCFRDQMLAICARVKAHELEFRATSFATLVQMVAGGDAVTLLPALAVNVEARGLKLRNFAAPAPHRTIVLAWRKSSPLRDALRKIGATLRSAAGVQ